ncbi:MAG: hypothetical protein WB817_09190 [Terriglobales bacterium]
MVTLRKLVLILLALSAPAFADDTKGWYDGCCQMMDFHFTHFAASAAGGELRLQLKTSLPISPQPDIWWGKDRVGSVTAQRCNKAGQCNEATRADIQLLKFSRRRAWGKYWADFSGEHIEGEFSVKYRKRVPLCTCE